MVLECLDYGTEIRVAEPMYFLIPIIHFLQGFARRCLGVEYFTEAQLLRRGYEPGNTLFYYRTRNDKEIDFVTRRGTKVEQQIKVCYDITSEKTRKRELDALVEASEELHCDNLLVITNDQEAQIEWKGKTISAISISHF